MIADWIKFRIDTLSDRQFRIIGAVFLVLIWGGIISLMLYGRSRLETIRRQVSEINNERKKAQLVLGRQAEVKTQRIQVDELLKKNPNFKIMGYFLDTIKDLGLEGKRKGNLNSSEQKLNNGYVEVKLSAVLNDIDMKQLSELLDEIEQNERIFTKTMEITHARSKRTIDVTITIATLQPEQK